MTEKKRATGLHVIRLAELRQKDFPPRPVLIEPWLRGGESVLLWAATGVGKSLLANTWALMVAGGGTVAGWTTRQPRKVLLVDGEMHMEDLKDRLAALGGTIEGFNPDLAGQNLSILARQDQAADVVFPDLAQRVAPDPRTQAGQDVIMAEIARVGAEVVVLDNLSTLAEVSDENEAAAMTPVLSLLMRFKQAGIACILVHHSGKSGKDYRGSSKLATTFEVIIGLERPEGQPATDGAIFGLCWGKYRGKPTAACSDVGMQLVCEEAGKWAWIVRPSEQTELRRIVEAVRTCLYRTQRELAEALGMSEVQITRGKARAISRGLITAQEWRLCLESPAYEEFEHRVPLQLLPTVATAGVQGDGEDF